jgi:hypothetical protein
MLTMKHNDDCITLQSHNAKLINQTEWQHDGGDCANWPSHACHECKCYAVAKGLELLADQYAESYACGGTAYAIVEENDKGELECDLDLPKEMRSLAEDWCICNPNEESPLWVRLAFTQLDLYEGDKVEKAFCKVFNLKVAYAEAMGEAEETSLRCCRNASGCPECVSDAE